MQINEIVTALVPQKKVLVIGAAFVDVVIGVDRLPSSGADVCGAFRGAMVGGCGFNVADVLEKLRLPFDLFLPLGTGPYSRQVKEKMLSRGYSLPEEIAGEDNGWCLSLVEASGERTFITVAGLETRMKREWFDGLDVASYDYVYLSGYELEGQNGAVILDVLARKKPEALILFDPGPRTEFIEPAIMNRLLRLKVMLTLNETEARAQTGLDSVEEAGRELHRRTGEPVVITQGGEGAMVISEFAQRVEAFPVIVKDTIGAGDSHTGGVLGGLMCGLSLETAVFLANKISSVVVERVGPANAPTREELLS